jgi:transcriptional regulator with XRE-family HTH domain
LEFAIASIGSSCFQFWQTAKLERRTGGFYRRTKLTPLKSQVMGEFPKGRTVKLLGGKIRDLRREGEWITVEDFAAAAGVSEKTISDIENNKTSSFPRTLRKIAKALKVDPLELVDMTPENFANPDSEPWGRSAVATISGSNGSKKTLNNNKNELLTAIDPKDELEVVEERSTTLGDRLLVEMSSRDLVKLIALYAQSLLDEFGVQSISFSPDDLRSGLLAALSPKVEVITYEKPPSVRSGSMFDPPKIGLAVGGSSQESRMVVSYRCPEYKLNLEESVEFAELLKVRDLLEIVLKTHGEIVVCKL